MGEVKEEKPKGRVEQLLESDEKFVREIVKKEKILPDLEKPLSRALSIRRRMQFALEQIRSNPLEGEAEKARAIRDEAGSLGESDLAQEADAMVQKGSKLSYRSKLRSARTINDAFAQIAYTATQITRTRLDAMLTSGTTDAKLLDVRRMMGDAEIDARKITEIAAERVPLFPVEALGKLEQAPVSPEKS